LNEVVLDASVVLKWFHSEGEDRLDAARELRRRYEAGELGVLAPPLLWLEIVNVAARRWGWRGAELEKLAAILSDLGFELIEPGIAAVASWAGRGLSAYDAAYVALAEETGATLVTDDAEILRVASEVAESLS
jgi:predicted nucleic acid-binding protein